MACGYCSQCHKCCETLRRVLLVIDGKAAERWLCRECREEE